MILPEFRILDGALPEASRYAWESRLRAQAELSAPFLFVQVTPMCVDPLFVELLCAARAICRADLELLQAVGFSIRKGHVTTPHVDVGEYVVLFFPADAPGAPLRLFDRSGSTDVEVCANRLLAFNATKITHQQVVPQDDVARLSVALKFRHP